MHRYPVMGNAIPASGKEGEIRQLLMLPFRQFPQTRASGALFPGEEDMAITLAYEENMFVDFNRGTPWFFQRERSWVAGDTEIVDGTLKAIGRTGRAV